MDYHIALGLFNPSKFNVLLEKSPAFGDYNTQLLNKNLRSLHIMKHRKGEDGLMFPLFFDGGGQSFAELGIPGSQELKTQYQIISEKRANGLL